MRQKKRTNVMLRTPKLGILTQIGAIFLLCILNKSRGSFLHLTPHFYHLMHPLRKSGKERVERNNSYIKANLQV